MPIAKEDKFTQLGLENIPTKAPSSRPDHGPDKLSKFQLTMYIVDIGEAP